MLLKLPVFGWCPGYSLSKQDRISFNLPRNCWSSTWDQATTGSFPILSSALLTSRTIQCLNQFHTPFALTHPNIFLPPARQLYVLVLLYFHSLHSDVYKCLYSGKVQWLSTLWKSDHLCLINRTEGRMATGCFEWIVHFSRDNHSSCLGCWHKVQTDPRFCVLSVSHYVSLNNETDNGPVPFEWPWTRKRAKIYAEL